MRLVVDANVLLASLLRNSTTRSLLLDPRLTLFSPEHLLTETERHLLTADRFRKRLGLSQSQLTSALTVLFSQISVMPQVEYQKHFQRALTLASHPEDAPYVAVALALDAPLWSNDKALKQQSVVTVYTTKQVIAKLKG